METEHFLFVTGLSSTDRKPAGRENFPQSSLLLMLVIRSLGAGIQTPAVNAVIPQLVPEDQLMRYNGINATMQSIVNFAAPAAAGAVFAISTLRTTLMIDIVTAILGTAVLLCITFPKQYTSVRKASVFSDMKIGITYAFSDRVIGKLLIAYGLFTFFCVPYYFFSFHRVEDLIYLWGLTVCFVFRLLPAFYYKRDYLPATEKNSIYTYFVKRED